MSPSFFVFLFLISFLSPMLGQAQVYLSPAQTLKQDQWQFDLEQHFFKMSGHWFPKSTDEPLTSGEDFYRLQTEARAHYAWNDHLEFYTGLRYRQNNATYTGTTPLVATSRSYDMSKAGL